MNREMLIGSGSEILLSWQDNNVLFSQLNSTNKLLGSENRGEISGSQIMNKDV